MKLLLIFSSLFFASGFNINFLQNPIVEKPIKQCPEYLEKYVVPLKDEYGDQIIKTATSSLPNADFTGHYILKANEYLIHNLLDTNFIDISHKKQIILWLIEQTMNGDAMGGKILDLYYDIVNCLL
tara:strand:- start:4481 stop:4858 length:378 start_codon:yes stop_codon:yes gene_type:complete